MTISISLNSITKPEPPKGGVLIDQDRFKAGRGIWSGRQYVCRRTTDENGKEICEVVKGYDHKVYNPATDGLYVFKSQGDCKAACICYDWVIIEPRSSSESSSRDSSQGTRGNDAANQFAYLERISNIPESGTDGKVVAIAQQNLRTNSTSFENQLTRTMTGGITIGMIFKQKEVVSSEMEAAIIATDSGISDPDGKGYTIWEASVTIEALIKGKALCRAVNACIPWDAGKVFLGMDYTPTLLVDGGDGVAAGIASVAWDGLSIACCGPGEWLTGTMAALNYELPASTGSFLFYSKGSGSNERFNSMEGLMTKVVGAHILQNVKVEANGVTTSLLNAGDGVATWLDSKSCSMCPGGADDDGGAINI
tara:strand:- start:1830 stop:2927 length:1098 start_codon:yes stop_codon:yes gene_type:complete